MSPKCAFHGRIWVIRAEYNGIVFYKLCILGLGHKSPASTFDTDNGRLGAQAFVNWKRVLIQLFKGDTAVFWW